MLPINNSEFYLKFIKEIQIFEETNEIKSKIFDVLNNFLIHTHTPESSYLLEKMIEHNYSEPKFEEDNMLLSYLKHRFNIKNLNLSLVNTLNISNERKENLEDLSKNDFELHKKYVKQGVNPSKILEIIRNDEIEKLQEISSQTNFDYSQLIEPSFYERCEIINHYYVSLIDYAAFFGSIKCFKFLLMNGSEIKNTFKYAIAGGNLEIIHICEQSHSSFEEVYESAIKFHRNEIFKYLYENKTEKCNNLEELGKFCILYHNYEILSFLIKEGMIINDVIINELAKNGNLFLVKYFLEFNQIPENIIIFSIQSGNIELVKYITKSKGIDINTKDIHIFDLIFILII